MVKKILLIITKDEIGGAQIAVLNLAKQFKREGISVTVGSGQRSFMAAELEKCGIPTILFKNLTRTFNPVRWTQSFWEFKTFLDKNKFDAIQLNSSNTLIAALAAKAARHKPEIIFTFHGLSYLDPGSDKNWLTKKIFFLIFKILLVFVDKNVFVCKSNLEEARRIQLVKTGTVIPNHIDFEALPAQEAREFLSKKTGRDLEGKVILGSIGRLAYPKNYEYFISEMGKIRASRPEVVGVIIGEGPERNKYEHLIEKEGLRNHFFLIGQITNAGSYLSAFDVFVLCSKYEGASITLLEASSLGLPILASNTGGTPEIIKNTGNFLFDLKPGELSGIFIQQYKALLSAKPKQGTNTKNKTTDTAREYLKII